MGKEFRSDEADMIADRLAPSWHSETIQFDPGESTQTMQFSFVDLGLTDPPAIAPVRRGLLSRLFKRRS